MLDRTSSQGLGWRVSPAAQTASRPSAYRADIDGLRGIAVAGVLAFHAFPTLLRGGFIGVDVFFVISGYLITGIIAQGLAAGTFSFTTFYARRVNRLFPALLLVCSTTYLLGWGYMLAPEFERLGRHLAAGAAFGANLILMHEAGYFDAAAASKPLLHLWSLSVEEQFYLAWPLLMWSAHKMRCRPLIVLLGAFICSFALNAIYAASGRGVTDFYSPLSRSWELAIGGVIACLDLRGLGARFRNICSAVGFAALGACMLLIDARVYPSWWALLPVSATALIIAAGRMAWLNRRILSSRSIVVVGLISYPLYLWHWPLLSFTTLTETMPPSVVERLCAIGLAVLLAVATYRWMELPLRSGSVVPWRRVVALCSGMVLVAGAGATTFADAGLPRRVANQRVIANAGELGHGPFFRHMTKMFRPCRPEAIYKEALIYDGIARCFQTKDGSPDLALIGDSHSEDLLVGLSARIGDRNIVSYAKDALPLLSVGAMARVFSYIAQDRTIRTVVVASAWNRRMHLEGAEDYESLKANLVKTARFLLEAQKEVFLVDDRPDFGYTPEFCKFSSGRLPFWVRNRFECTIKASDYIKAQAPFAAMLDEISATLPGVRILHAGPAFCDAQHCRMAADGILLYRDSDHLTIEGSNRLGRQLVAEQPSLAH